jgi:hypothetical protein
MNKTTKTLGKILIVFIVIAIACGVGSMLIINYDNGPSKMDDLLGWTSVLFVMLSFLLLIVFLTMLFIHRRRKI